jgi:head-tail adaptor
MAKVETLGGEELEVARKVYPEATHRVTGRYMPGITTRYRMVAANGHILDIGHINNVEWLDRELRFLVKEQV